MNRETLLALLHRKQAEIMGRIARGELGPLKQSHGHGLESGEVQAIVDNAKAFRKEYSRFKEDSGKLVISRKMLAGALAQTTNIRQVAMNADGTADVPLPKAALELRHMEDRVREHDVSVRKKEAGVLTVLALGSSVFAGILTCIYAGIGMNAMRPVPFFISADCITISLAYTLHTLVTMQGFRKNKKALDELRSYVRDVNMYSLHFTSQQPTELLTVQVRLRHMFEEKEKEALAKTSVFQANMKGTLIFLISVNESLSWVDLAENTLTIPGELCAGVRLEQGIVFQKDSLYFFDYELGAEDMQAIESYIDSQNVCMFL